MKHALCLLLFVTMSAHFSGCRKRLPDMTRAELHDRQEDPIGTITESTALEQLEEWLTEILKRRPENSLIGAVRPERLLVIQQDGNEKRVEIFGLIDGSGKRWVTEQEIERLDSIFLSPSP